jgi:hypothetical protein
MSFSISMSLHAHNDAERIRERLPKPWQELREAMGLGNVFPSS